MTYLTITARLILPSLRHSIKQITMIPTINNIKAAIREAMNPQPADGVKFRNQ